jgi:hypothetical protein
MTVAVSLLAVMIPGVAMGQTPDDVTARTATGPSQRERMRLQVAAGPTLIGEGSVISAALGYSPVSRLDLFASVERIHLPFELEEFPGGQGATRGGTLMFVTGEARFTLRPNRLSPFVMAGGGAGVSRPTVNATFPDPVRNDLRVLYIGGGVSVPLRGGFRIVGEARCMLALEGYDSVLAVWPVRAGVAWRF